MRVYRVKSAGDEGGGWFLPRVLGCCSLPRGAFVELAVVVRQEEPELTTTASSTDELMLRPFSTGSGTTLAAQHAALDTPVVASAFEVPHELLHGPFRMSDAAALGVPRHVLRGRRFRHLVRGIYVGAEVPDGPAVRFDAVRLLVPSAVGSHATAVQLRDLPVPADGRTYVTLPTGGAYPRIAGVHACLAPLGDDVLTVDGRPVLSVERTFLDLAGSRPALNLVDLVIFGDAAVRHGWTKPELLIERAGSAHGRGVRLARRAAALVRRRVDSPMETRLRLLLVLAGLPEPAVNQPINDMGGWLATPDLSYPGWKIAIEYDGDHHRTERRQWAADKRRRRMLREQLQILECTADDVLRRPEEMLRWVHEHLIAAGHPSVPTRLLGEWRHHCARAANR